MDGDGDLDICCLAQVDTVFESGDGADTYRVIWFENIGYEKSPPPLAADLNRDGNVDGVDLGLLLAAWGS
jgi:hypothetical protein